MNVLGCESVFTTASNASVQVAPKAKQLSSRQILFSARLALAFPTIQLKKKLVKPRVVTKNHPADSWIKNDPVGGIVCNDSAFSVMKIKRDFKTGLELVSKELNHLAANLHVYDGGLNFMK